MTVTGDVPRAAAEVRRGEPLAGPASTGPVVVGVDASDASRHALRWASRYAKLTGARLEVVHAWHAAEEYVWLPQLPPPTDVTEVAKNAVEQLVAESVDPDVETVVSVVEGHATRVLADAAKGAALLVVGSRGRGGFDGLTLGSVSAQCAVHARCSVVVVRPEESAS